MKPFMSNTCGYPYCRDYRCNHCALFKPKFLGIRVPKIIGNWLYDLEAWLMYKRSDKF